MVFHIFLLGMLVTFGLFGSDSVGFKMSLVLFYCAAGYLFGVTQIRKYTNNHHWSYFINRPLSTKKIFFALFLAAITAIAVVIILPFFTVTFLLDTLNVGIIDLRHYSQLAYLMGMTLSFYLLACYITLSKRKSHYLLIMMILLPIISINVGGSVYWLLSGVIIWLFIMVLSLVKANLNGLPNGYLNQSVTAIAIQYSLYFILTSLFFLISEVALDVAYRAKDNSNNNSSVQAFDSSSFRDVIFLNTQDALVTSLHTENNKYQDLIEEIQLNQTKRIRKRIWFHPTKQQLPFMDENKTIIKDSDNNVVWQFSHDLMLFVGKNTINKKTVGYLGPDNLYISLQEINKDQAFKSVPWVNHDQVVVKNKVYQFQNNSQSFRLLFSANEDEVLLNGLQDQGSVKSIITSKNLYIFDSIDYDNDITPLKAQMAMPLPSDYNNIWDIQIAEVVDRFIVSFHIGKSFRHDVYQAEQLTYDFVFSGPVNLINQRDLNHSPTMLIKDLDYFISPAWKLALDYFPLHPSRDRYLEERPQMQTLSNSTLVTLLILAVMYALITVLLSKKRHVTMTNKLLWTALNTVLGLPGIYSFILLYPKHNRINEAQISLNEKSGAQHV